jgi:hypothetical protein
MLYDSGQGLDIFRPPLAFQSSLTIFFLPSPLHILEMSSTTSSTSSLGEPEARHLTTPTPSMHRPATHPFLSPNRALAINTWTTSLPQRETRPLTRVDSLLPQDAAIEAYRQLKLALFSHARRAPGSNIQPTNFTEQNGSGIAAP